MLPVQEPAKIVSLFYCYANQDKFFQEQLRAHLGQLLRKKLLTDWDLMISVLDKRKRKKSTTISTPLIFFFSWSAQIL